MAGPAGIAALLLAGALSSAALSASCGKKGPPLAPIIRVPAAVEGFAARRIGDRVYIRFAIPTANADKSVPADISRVDVYGYTGAPGSNDNLVRRGTLVARIPVMRPAAPGEEARPPAGNEAAPAAQAHAGERADGAVLHEQGSVVTLFEELTPEVVAEVPPLQEKKVTPPETDPRAKLLLWSDVPPVPVRIYTAVGSSRRGRRGPFAARVAVPLVPPPEAPSDVKVEYTEEKITLRWSPPASARRPVQEPSAETSLPSKSLVPVYPATRYNVYLAKRGPEKTAWEAPPAEASAATTETMSEFPAPLNEKPLDSETFDDPNLVFGEERCYIVRAVDTFDGAQVEGAASEMVCVTPADVFPPAAPRNLAAVSSGGVVSLIWEPNTEPDLAGYLVLRGDAGDETLQPVTPSPIMVTTFRDTTVQVGRRYVYAVVAVDRAVPPNMSPMSNRVEETAR